MGIYLLGNRFEPALEDRRARPNEGIRRSFRLALVHGGLNAVFAAAALAALIAVGASATSAARTALVAGYAGVLYGISRGFRFGGVACVYYWTIRMILARRCGIPLRYQRFLHDAEQRHLLRRTGSGFSFPHPLIHQHLAVPLGDDLRSRLDPERHADSSSENAPPGEPQPVGTTSD
jgi:hypothetical protein